jgi:hypothetical protein
MAPGYAHSFARVVVALATLAALAWSVWTIAGPLTEDLRSGAVVSPIEAKQREILSDNLDKPGDPVLVRRYVEINARHFNGRLPLLPVIWEPRLAEVGALAKHTFTLEGMFGHIGGKAAILLHPNLQRDPAALDRALAHEMVHAHLFSTGQPSSNHGPAFRGELERLAHEGAFTGILADAATRANLRAWLDTEAARLDADGAEVRLEGEAIERERGEIEQAFAEINSRGPTGGPAPTREEVDALNARRDAYNRRVEQANVRAQLGRKALAEFNRQVERYNLMLVYPDGVDEEELFKPRPSPTAR